VPRAGVLRGMSILILLIAALGTTLPCMYVSTADEG
jgi:hypothetical protein